MNAEEIKEVTAKELSEFIRSWCDDIPGVRQNRCRIFLQRSVREIYGSR